MENGEGDKDSRQLGYQNENKEENYSRKNEAKGLEGNNYQSKEKGGDMGTRSWSW